MTVQELAEQIAHLSADEQRELLEILKQRIPDADAEKTTEDEGVNPEELFREGWADAMEGGNHPIDTLWNDLEDEVVRGLLATDQFAPSDEEVQNGYTEYLDEKYR